MAWKDPISLAQKVPQVKDLALRLISLRGAREHNLKNLNVDIPRGQLVVVTGVSGSGNPSLAFDTLFAEGQRRYVESLSAYARQFISQLEKPDLDTAEGLSPAIAIDQKSGSRNPRSTVGTVTEIHDYLRLLYARVGRAHCPDCGHVIAPQTLKDMVERVMQWPAGTPVAILAPMIRGRKGIYQKELEELRESGFTRIRLNGKDLALEEEIKLDRQKKHTIEVYVDRLKLKSGIETRLRESLEIALRLANGMASAEALQSLPEISGKKNQSNVLEFNESMACLHCGRNFVEMEPRLFSFNSPYGACPTCDGLGYQKTIDAALLVPDPQLSIAQGAVSGMEPRFKTYFSEIFSAIATHFDASPDVPFSKLPQKVKEGIFYGTGDAQIKTRFKRRIFGRATKQRFMGLIPYLMRRFKEAEKDSSREWIEQFMDESLCSSCLGARLRPEALSVKIGHHSIAQLSDLPISEAFKVIEDWKLTAREQLIATRVLKEVKERLQFLLDVGVSYLNLSRSMATLAGGEAQRIRLATQIGSQLVGVLYVLDEPSIGLHPRDNERLIKNLMRLRDAGNSVVVVEHDEETMRASDFLIDMGPGAGRLGGEIVYAGDPKDITKDPHSLTGAYLSGRKRIEVPKERKTSDKILTIRGASSHNLKNIDVHFPLGVLIAVTGVSGSGKSTLVKDTLYEWFRHSLYNWKDKDPDVKKIFRSIEGDKMIDKVIHIDQKSIGRTPRSNPATYTGVFSQIRDIFSQMPESRLRGWKPGRFSFNVKGGRCEACQGGGMKKIEMHFLPDTFVRCEVCRGKRYENETLQVRFRGANIAEVLDMTINDALVVFENVPFILHKLKTLVNVGLGYLTLGQSATTLSGGEAQRIKLSRELAKRGTGKTLYILDEPTTGLHFDDINQLLFIFKELVARNNTVVVIEHNLDVVKSADYVIDLGPEGGGEGGYVVATGTPEEIVQNRNSLTGQYLKPYLNS